MDKRYFIFIVFFRISANVYPYNFNDITLSRREILVLAFLGFSSATFFAF